MFESCSCHILVVWLLSKLFNLSELQIHFVSKQKTKTVTLPGCLTTKVTVTKILEMLMWLVAVDSKCSYYVIVTSLTMILFRMSSHTRWAYSSNDCSSADHLELVTNLDLCPHTSWWPPYTSLRASLRVGRQADCLWGALSAGQTRVGRVLCTQRVRGGAPWEEARRVWQHPTEVGREY